MKSTSLMIIASFIYWSDWMAFNQYHLTLLIFLSFTASSFLSFYLSNSSVFFLWLNLTTFEWIILHSMYSPVELYHVRLHLILIKSRHLHLVWKQRYAELSQLLCLPPTPSSSCGTKTLHSEHPHPNNNIYVQTNAFNSKIKKNC